MDRAAETEVILSSCSDLANYSERYIIWGTALPVTLAHSRSHIFNRSTRCALGQQGRLVMCEDKERAKCRMDRNGRQSCHVSLFYFSHVLASHLDLDVHPTIPT